jgi:GNAT superfamily N-acetyltransferase
MSEVAVRPAEPTPDEVQYLEDRIYEFKSSATGIADGEWLAFFVRERDRIVAGICGNTWGGTCELRQFWVEQSKRGRGLGTKLFEAAEEARRRGCSQIVLMTFSFQAPAFYKRHGFEVLATIEDHPRGHGTLFAAPPAIEPPLAREEEKRKRNADCDYERQDDVEPHEADAKAARFEHHPNDCGKTKQEMSIVMDVVA